MYIVKYRRSIAFRIIYIGGHFSVAREGETHRPQKVAQVAFCPCSEHHAVLIGCQHQGCPYYCLRDRSDANLGKRAVSFAACLVCGFPTFNLRSTAEQWTGVMPSLLRA